MLEFLYDARRFILKFRYIAGVAPLQLYISGLTFAPNRSIIKKLFLKDKPDWISIPKNIENNWDAQLQTFEGHTEELQCIAFSSNGLLLASGAEDCTVKIWEVATGTLRQIFTGYKDSVLRVAFSPDAQVLASISRDGIIRLWDIATGVLQRSIDHKTDSIYDAAFSPDINLLATRGLLKTSLWDLKLGIQKYELGGKSFANPSLVFSANGLLLAGASGGDIVVWDTTTGTIRQTIKGQSEKERVESLAFSPNGQLLASSHRNSTTSNRLSTVKLWDAITGIQKYRFKAHSSGNRVTISPDNRFLAIGHPNDTTLWDLTTYRLYKENSNPASIIAYSPDGRTLASSHRNGTIELWDLDAEFLNQEFYSTSIKDIEFSSNGKLVVTSPEGGISVWNSSQETQQILTRNWKSINDRKGLIALSVDGRFLAYHNWHSKYIEIRDIDSDIHWSILIGKPCIGMTFSPNSQRLATVTLEGISFWVYTGDCTQRPSPTKRYGYDDMIGVSQQGIESDECWVLERTSKRTGKEGYAMDLDSISFYPDGRQLFLLPFIGKIAEIWDWSSVQTIELPSVGIESVAFSADGQLLARRIWYDRKNERTVYGPLIEPLDMDTGKLHKTLVRKGQVDETAFLIGPPPVEGLEFLKLQNQYVKCRGIEVFTDDWVEFQGRLILWLPPKYRPTRYAARGTTLALGHRWEEITFIKFSRCVDFKI